MGLFRLPFNDDAKRRKLDELFADEPHLSPTMKARRLHEKLQEAEEAAQGLPTEAFVTERAPGPALPAEEARPTTDEGPLPPLRSDELLILSEAGRYLRATPDVQQRWAEQGRIAPACAVRLRRFREGALCEWLKALADPD